MFGAFAVLQRARPRNPERLRQCGVLGRCTPVEFPGRLASAATSVNGVLVLVMVLLAGIGGLRPGSRGDDDAGSSAWRARRGCGNWLFVPALVIPAVAVLGTLFLKHATVGGKPLVDPTHVTLISLALGVVCRARRRRWCCCGRRRMRRCRRAGG